MSPNFKLKIADKDGVRELNWDGGVAPTEKAAKKPAAAAVSAVAASSSASDSKDEKADAVMKAK